MNDYYRKGTWKINDHPAMLIPIRNGYKIDIKFSKFDLDIVQVDNDDDGYYNVHHYFSLDGYYRDAYFCLATKESIDVEHYHEKV